MCVDVRKQCGCGKHTIQFLLRDNVMTGKVIENLYCPECGRNADFNPVTMLRDNGWIIEYNMEMARFFASGKLGMEPEFVSPAFIFDEGYVTWLEMYPGEKEDIADERSRIIKLHELDKMEYLRVMSNWTIERVARLKSDGWRKAKLA